LAKTPKRHKIVKPPSSPPTTSFGITVFGIATFGIATGLPPQEPNPHLGL